MSLELKNALITDFEDIFKLLEQLWSDTKLVKENLANVYSYNLAREETFDKVVFLDNKIIAISSVERCKAIELDSAFFRKSAHKFYTNIGFEKRGYVFSKLL